MQQLTEPFPKFDLDFRPPQDLVRRIVPAAKDVLDYLLKAVGLPEIREGAHHAV
jgi:hypothetical protein